MIKDVFKNNKIVAVEMFSAGVCNLDCSYCYIPKKKELSLFHNAILDNIKTDNFVEQIIRDFGEETTAISHWGTEPTLTISEYKKSDFYKKLLVNTPNFSKITLSSNFLRQPDDLIEFIYNLPQVKNRLMVSVQMSLDGPDYITDKNRKLGSTNTIIKNILSFTKSLKDIQEQLTKNNIYVHSHFKPTHYIDEIKLLTDKKYVYEYCDIFEYVIGELNKYVNPTFEFNNDCNPTLVYPGRYTVEDGKNYLKYIMNFDEVYKEKKYKNAFFTIPYKYALEETIHFLNSMFVCKSNSSCSAGNSQVGLADKNDYTICHRYFYMNDNNVYDSIFNESIKDNKCYSGNEYNRHEISKRYLFSDEYNAARVLYVTKLYNDYQRHKLNAYNALIKEMSDCGQIDKIFSKDTGLALLLSIFFIKRSCPAENIITTGSIYLSSTSFFKLFGNGAFEYLCKSISELENVIR